MTVVRFTDGRQVDVIDADCEFRPCFRFGFDKGPFTPGVGYTSYYPKEREVCMTRHLNGCPHIGAHVVCGECRATLGVALGDERPDLPESCSKCGATDLYWFADVLPEPEPCCDDPRVAPNPRAYWQRCRSCGTTLRGTRLEIVRARYSA